MNRYYISYEVLPSDRPDSEYGVCLVQAKDEDSARSELRIELRAKHSESDTYPAVVVICDSIEVPDAASDYRYEDAKLAYFTYAYEYLKLFREATDRESAAALAANLAAIEIMPNALAYIVISEVINDKLFELMIDYGIDWFYV